MTTRLTRWLTTLDNFEAKMAQLPAVRRYGRLTRATGLVLEATGLQLPLGATCVIERQNGSETHEFLRSCECRVPPMPRALPKIFAIVVSMCC